MFYDYCGTVLGLVHLYARLNHFSQSTILRIDSAIYIYLHDRNSIYLMSNIIFFETSICVSQRTTTCGRDLSPRSNRRSALQSIRKLVVLKINK